MLLDYDFYCSPKDLLKQLEKIALLFLKTS